MPSLRGTTGGALRYVSSDWLDTRCDVRLFIFYIQQCSWPKNICPFATLVCPNQYLGSHQDGGNVCSSPQVSLVFDHPQLKTLWPQPNYVVFLVESQFVGCWNPFLFDQTYLFFASKSWVYPISAVWPISESLGVGEIKHTSPAIPGLFLFPFGCFSRTMFRQTQVVHIPMWSHFSIFMYFWLFNVPFLVVNNPFLVLGELIQVPWSSINFWDGSHVHIKIPFSPHIFHMQDTKLRSFHQKATYFSWLNPTLCRLYPGFFMLY